MLLLVKPLFFIGLKQFKNGRDLIEDDERISQSVCTRTEDNVKVVTNLLAVNHLTMCRIIKQDLGRSNQNCAAVLDEKESYPIGASSVVP